MSVDPIDMMVRMRCPFRVHDASVETACQARFNTNESHLIVSKSLCPRQGDRLSKTLAFLKYGFLSTLFAPLQLFVIFLPIGSDSS